jgi:hypothetical protein
MQLIRDLFLGLVCCGYGLVYLKFNQKFKTYRFLVYITMVIHMCISPVKETLSWG